MKHHIGFLLITCFTLWVAASWITHIAVCIKSEAWVHLIAGAIFVPWAVVHGTGAWFGAW